MARDFTDYITLIFGTGERVYHLDHIRQLKKDDEVSEFDFNDRKYMINKDRAMRVRWQPWKKWDKEARLRSINEMFRTKKVGLIVYREPPKGEQQYMIVEKEVPKDYGCMICDFKTDHERVIKAHVTKKHKGAKPEMVIIKNLQIVKESVAMQEIVEPMHISRIRQPSGVIMTDVPPGEFVKPQERADPRPPEQLEDENYPPLTETISPRVFKAMVDSPQFRRQYKSFKFGNLTPITGKWWLWVAIAFVAIFVILIMTGNFQM